MKRLLRWLRSSNVTPAPDELVVLRNLPLHEGPMTVALLQRHGIPATGRDVWSQWARSTNRYVVLVPFASVDAAEDVLARY